MRYLTYEEYQSLGGTCSRDAFPLLQFDVESKMDYITVGRLSKMIEDIGTVPEEVQMSEVKLVNIYSTSSNTDKAVGLTSYSNGIESFGYDTQKSYEEHLLDTCYSVLMEYLYPKYPELFYRGRCYHER